MSDEKFERIRTLGSMYDMNSVEVTDKEGNHFRIKVDEFLKLLNNPKVTVTEEKSRKHTYLKLEVGL